MNEETTDPEKTRVQVQCTEQKPMAIVLLSGGMDSAVTLAIAQEDFQCIALVFDYGQLHRSEIQYALQTIQQRHLENHFVMKLPMPFGSSPLTDPSMVLENSKARSISTAFVPGRNLIFLSFTVAWAWRLHVHHIFIGVNAQDQEGFPDCRPEFFRAFEVAARLTLDQEHFYIQTPLLSQSKENIIRTGRARGVDFTLTRSCYRLSSTGISCGICDACKVRLAGFRAVGVEDPIPYREV